MIFPRQGVQRKGQPRRRSGLCQPFGVRCGQKPPHRARLAPASRQEPVIVFLLELVKKSSQQSRTAVFDSRAEQGPERAPALLTSPVTGNQEPLLPFPLLMRWIYASLDSYDCCGAGSQPCAISYGPPLFAPVVRSGTVGTAEGVEIGGIHGKSFPWQSPSKRRPNPEWHETGP
jgi:hypothetical protein